jgi:hypothetical protein
MMGDAWLRLGFPSFWGSSWMLQNKVKKLKGLMSACDTKGKIWQKTSWMLQATVWQVGGSCSALVQHSNQLSADLTLAVACVLTP